MEDKFISYNDIFDGQNPIPRELEKKPSDIDPYIVEDLATLFAINDIYNEADNFFEITKKKYDLLNKKLNYSYDGYWFRKDSQSKNALEAVKWKEDLSLVREQDKIDLLAYIREKGLIVDKLKFLDEDDDPVICLSCEIWDIDTWGEDDDDCCVFILPEFVLSATWRIEKPEDDLTWEIDIEQIKEIIVDEIKYTFI